MKVYLTIHSYPSVSIILSVSVHQNKTACFVLAIVWLTKHKNKNKKQINIEWKYSYFFTLCVFSVHHLMCVEFSFFPSHFQYKIRHKDWQTHSDPLLVSPDNHVSQIYRNNNHFKLPVFGCDKVKEARICLQLPCGLVTAGSVSGGAFLHISAVFL